MDLIPFEQKVLNTVQKYNMIESGDRVVIGLSGGADSCALLRVLHSLRKILNIELVAAHLNHGIRGAEALRDKEFSKSFAEIHSVPFVSKDVSVPEYAMVNKLSSEAAGRALRYEFFHEVCTQYNCNKIAVAHNINDRAETILLNVIRGSASKGFEGIKAVNNNVIRPLIEASRNEIEEYAHINGIDYVTDSTNFEDIYARNIIRNEVLPQMKGINSNVVENIIRCSEIISSESEYIDDVVKKENIISVSGENILVDKKRFYTLHPAIKRRSIMTALLLLCGNTHNVSSKQIQAICQNSSTGKTYYFGNGANAVVNADNIELSHNPFCEVEYEYSLSVPGIIEIQETASAYKLEYVHKYIKKPGSMCLSLDNIEADSPLFLRTKKDGDLFRPYGMRGTKKIKKFFIDLKIPLHERPLYPLLACNDKILAVIPLRISEECRVTNKSKKILMITKLGGTYDK